MARFTRLDVLNNIVNIGVIPIFYQPNLKVAKKIVTACAEGGARVIEFTNRGDNAFRVFSELVMHISHNDLSIILGVGSILDPVTGGLYISSGANFIVGSVFNPELAMLCNRHKVAYCPGCGSASEISRAEELGVEIVKVFPGDAVGGPNFVKTILGPTPWTRIMPTGGVEATQASITAWFNAGVTAVGIGSDLIRKEWVQSENYEAISQLTAQVVEWARVARGLDEFPGVGHIGLIPKSDRVGKKAAE
jgi:2-dehydro-3-deoxyphosphogluconate aldolase / (4S)-4-hydroxy-2-oxoglutarate aldolase